MEIMRKPWYSSIKAKLTLIITLLSLTGLGFLLAMFSAMERKTLADFEREKMLFVENFVGVTLTPIMLTGQGAKVMPLIVENYRHMANINNLNIIRTNGEEAFADGETIKKVNEFLFEDKFSRENLRPAEQVVARDNPRLKKLIETNEKQIFLETLSNGGKLTHMMIPIENSRDCHTCHGKTERLRGVVVASFSMEEIENKIQNDLLLLTVIALAAVAFIAGAIFFTFNYIFVNPATSIVRQVKSLVETDRYDTRIKINSNDEVGELASALNYFITSVEDFRFKQEKEKERLEKAVQERTKELKEKNDFIENDLKLAQRIQTKLLPEKFPDIKGMDFHASYMPSLHIGGDYYDVFEMGNDYVGLFVADASGHGSSAALLVSIVKALMSTIGKDISSPSYVIQMVNKTLAKMTPDDSFVTLFYGIINTKTGRMHYCLAGHPTPIIFNRDTLKLTTFKTNGGLVGIFENDTFEDSEYVLKPGDRVVVYTDGILEATDTNKKLYGMDRLVTIIKETIGLSCERVAEYLLKDLEKYAGAFPLADDVTIVFLDYNIR